jgi:glycosyltransferase involved in cell wall biosynthesis
MKVIQVGAFFYPSVGGVERQMEEIAAHLIDQDIDVAVYTTNATHGHQKKMPEYRPAETYRGFVIKRFPYQLRLGHFFRLSLPLLWRLCRDEYDVVHLHNTHDGHTLPTILICKFRKKPLVITGHNPYVVDAQKRGAMLNLFVKFYDFVLRLFSFGITKYIALLDSEKKTVIQKYKLPAKDIVIIPNGIQEIFYTATGDAERFYRDWEIKPNDWQLIVGTASRLNFVKGIHNLRMAVKRAPEVLFIFAGGDDGYMQELKNIFRSDKNVLFTERYLPSDEVRNFYAAIDMFLLPSIYEPFGMTTVEAMAQGKPVLATNAGGTLEIVKPEFGELITPQDQEAWLEKIKHYSEHRSDLEKMGKAARETALQYQWSEVIPQIMKVYKSVTKA